MGGIMSVNDEAEFPFLVDELHLIEQAVAANLPVIGHCLGGQLIRKALGGSVRAKPVPECERLQIVCIATGCRCPKID
jgi:GMP synthase-like glutamine amidotransferase